VIKESTSKVMIDLLVHWVDHWYAKTAWVPGYRVAGKTGTSQIAYKGKYEDINGIGTKIGSFGWFAPAEDPKFVIIVKVDRPRIVWDWGSATAAVTFWKISQYLFNYFAIPKK
jgi:cell division protein FtsI/penicillin-binding protein 2